jgi:hypothetical protein
LALPEQQTSVVSPAAFDEAASFLIKDGTLPYNRVSVELKQHEEKAPRCCGCERVVIRKQQKSLL